VVAGGAVLIGAAAIGGAACAGGRETGALGICGVALAESIGGGAGVTRGGGGGGVTIGLPDTAGEVGGSAGMVGAAGLVVAGGFATGGVITLGGGGATGGFGGVTTPAALAGGATAVLLSGTGGCGTAGRGGATVAADCFWLIALSTSPGLEIWDRSILVLISSASPRAERVDLDGAAWASAFARKWARTFSASCSSRELECVFFSVTPTSKRTSRIALLLTSSSLARSLIRILLIRLFLPPLVPLSLHISLTELLSVPHA